MLSRRPVIASRGGGAEEILIDGETGLLFRACHSDDLASRVLEILCGKTQRDRMVDAAYRSAVERFELSEIVDEINGIVLAAVRKPRNAPFLFKSLKRTQPKNDEAEQDQYDSR
jgi:glycosyltransferase involved in cell wall biosynthesis